MIKATLPPPRPEAHDRDYYTILCRAEDGDFYIREAVEEDMTLFGVQDLLAECSDPVAVFRFNPFEGNSDDVSEDIARAWFNRIADDLEYDAISEKWDCPQFIRDHHPDLDWLLRQMRAEDVSAQPYRPVLV